MYFKSPLIWTLFVLSIFGNSTRAQTDTIQHIVQERTNSLAQQKKPYVILISADGFRWDYAQKYSAQHLLSFAKKGVEASSMSPSYPSVTFPNHYTLVTGMYPSHHGLVSNTFIDSLSHEKYSMGNKEKVKDAKWYGGTPLWVLAEQHQMLSASMFWVGSEAKIKGIRPTYYYSYNEKIPVEKRINKVREWLMLPEDKRPHLITFYLSEPDHASHSYGPESRETEQAVKMVDSIMYQLSEAVASTGLSVNFIFLADHGMTAVDRQSPIPTPKEIDPEKFNVISSGTLVDIRAKNKTDILPLYKALKEVEKDYTTYLKQDMPKHLHYSAQDDKMGRIGDILLMPKWPRVFSNKTPGAGYHGFDPTQVKDMHAIFMAWGPSIHANKKIQSFENVHVYPLIAQILGLRYNDQIDGKPEILSPIIKR